MSETGIQFGTYSEALAWAAERAASLGMTALKFTSTEEYKTAYPAIQAVYKKEHPGPRKRAARIERPLFGASLLLHCNTMVAK